MLNYGRIQVRHKIFLQESQHCPEFTNNLEIMGTDFQKSQSSLGRWKLFPLTARMELAYT